MRSAMSFHSSSTGGSSGPDGTLHLADISAPHMQADNSHLQ